MKHLVDLEEYAQTYKENSGVRQGCALTVNILPLASAVRRRIIRYMIISGKIQRRL